MTDHRHIGITAFCVCFVFGSCFSWAQPATNGVLVDGYGGLGPGGISPSPNAETIIRNGYDGTSPSWIYLAPKYDATYSHLSVGTSATETTISASSPYGGGFSKLTVNQQGLQVLQVGVNGSSSMTVGDQQISLNVGRNGFNTHRFNQVIGADYHPVNGNTNTQEAVAGAIVNNIIVGNTLIDGDLHINGRANYYSTTSASTSVSSGQSILVNATHSTSGQVTVLNRGSAGPVLDANGKILVGTAPQATAALTVSNGIGNTHGFVVTEDASVMSGGINSTSLTLNDSGARFSNSTNGAPVLVTGIANGRSDYDAVNYQQLKQVAGGVASASAMANIPQVDQNKTIAIGAALGHFQSMTSLALGASYRMAPSAIIRASVSSNVGRSEKDWVYGLGAGFSF